VTVQSNLPAAGALSASTVSLGVRARDSRQLAAKLAAARDHGLSRAWLYDSGRCIEAYAALGASVARFRDMSLGVAVTNFVTRHIVVLANALATSANLSDHGIRCVLGRGDSAVKFIGRKPQPVSEFERDLATLRALLAGDAVLVNGARYRLPEPPGTPVAVFVSADGPRMWDIAGRLADGALIGKSAFPGHLARAVPAIREAEAGAGRPAGSVQICAWVHCAGAAERETAIDWLWPEVGRSVLHALRTGHRTVPPGERQEITQLALRQDSEFLLSARLRELFGDEILDDYTVVGTYGQCRSKLEELAGTDGVNEVAINVYPVAPDSGVSGPLGAILSGETPDDGASRAGTMM
jgi:alkanesulfonate monooxygenase SsuD/methylene tetrahydromethanopterin reductase-like flavin-dependent oxidoreductase (luciferase family)